MTGFDKIYDLLLESWPAKFSVLTAFWIFNSNYLYITTSCNKRLLKLCVPWSTNNELCVSYSNQCCYKTIFASVTIIRRNHSCMFYKIDVLKCFPKFTVKTPVPESLFSWVCCTSQWNEANCQWTYHSIWFYCSFNAKSNVFSL